MKIFAPNLWINPGEIPSNSLDDDNNGFIDDVQGWNFVNASNNVTDVSGHGTMVAGIAAARTNNTLGVAGVCGNCRIMSVKSHTRYRCYQLFGYRFRYLLCHR